MGSSVEELSISLEHDIDEQYQYQPGEIVRGNIHVKTNRRTVVRTISISVHGQGVVAWEDPDYGSFNADEEYINASQIVRQHSKHDPLVIDKGFHTFPFDYQLPTNLPSSFIGKFGSVTYVLKAVIQGERPGETSITSEPFLVLRRAPLPEKSRQSAGANTEKRFWSKLRSGKIKVQIEVSKLGATPGEDIIICAEVANKSPVRVTAVQACLLMNSLYHAKQRAIPFRQIVNKRRDEYELLRGDGRRWQNVRLTVPPYIPETALEFCDIIEITYFLQFRVETSGGKEIRLELPILIGSRPAGLELPANGHEGGNSYNRQWNTMTKDFPFQKELPPQIPEQPTWHDGLIPEMRGKDSTMVNPLFSKQPVQEQVRMHSEPEHDEIMETTKL
ncbi:hypothetical protein FSP39_005527 [Pinctada imbricata]|uniref:Arrestin C-terminal-like domain-containing protein n=1 Tax=Pinctada imbricata TaxID=66713 RepID=A0AA88Y1E9_PINIB|nr:hypothetical protein FSP39_005527 [Pinctada imbricata]